MSAPPGHEDYRRLWRRAARRELGRVAGTLAAAAPGFAVGLWFTDGWASEWVATQVVVLGAVITIAAGTGGWWLVGRMRVRRSPEPPPMLRAVLRGEVGLVTPPHREGAHATGPIVGLVVLAVWLLAATVGVRAGAFQPDRAQALLPVVVLAASHLVGLLSQRLGPRVALFPGRIEIRRAVGSYLVPWSAVALVGTQDERVVVYLRGAGLTTRRGWVRRHPGYGVPVGPSGVPAGVVIKAIERYRSDPIHPSFREGGQ